MCLYDQRVIGPTTPRLALGTAAFGGLYEHVEDDEATAVVHRALQEGITHLDTAPQYGHGTAERRLGAALAAVPRSTFAVSTKVGRLIEPADTVDSAWFVDAPASVLRFDYSGDGVRRSLDASLDRLRLDYVDTLLIHDPDDHLDWALNESLPALQALRDEGVVRSIGVGVNTVSVALTFVERGGVDVVLIAGRHTLLDRSAADELLPRCQQEGVEVWAAGVFNSGLLAGTLSSKSIYDYLAAPQAVLHRARALAGRCDAYGVQLGAAALHSAAAHPAISEVLLGPRSVAELEQNLRWWQQSIPDELMRALHDDQH
jgi:D-threo-aldose 1-dehydrogenase